MHENTKIVTEYAHGGGEASDEMSDLWSYDAPQQRTYHYCLYEARITVEVDLDTGQWRYLALDGVGLEHPTEWSRIVK